MTQTVSRWTSIRNIYAP